MMSAKRLTTIETVQSVAIVRLVALHLTKVDLTMHVHVTRFRSLHHVHPLNYRSISDSALGSPTAHEVRSRCLANCSAQSHVYLLSLLVCVDALTHSCTILRAGVYADADAAQFLGGYEGGAGAGERIEDGIALVGKQLDKPGG